MSNQKSKPVIINKELCIGCGKCVRDCVSEKLEIKDGKANFKYNSCIECGHCYAICPTKAVTMANNAPEEDEEIYDMSEFDSDKLLKAMKSRRTIRQFKDKKISPEMIEKIIESGRYCPTGTNSQDFSFIVIQDSLRDIEEQAVKIFRKAQKAASPFSDYVRNIEIDDSFFFKGAPLVILVCGKGESSSYLASSYMELMAESMGLGVLYSGFFVGVTKLSKKIASMIDFNKDHKAVTCLVIGYPDVEYKRIPPRKKAKVSYM